MYKPIKMYKPIEEQIDNKFKELVELFDKVMIMGKNSTIEIDGKQYYVECSIRPQKSSKPSPNSHKSTDMICDCGHRMSTHTLLGYCTICKKECNNEE